MGKDLIIVESPAKVKTISKFLGAEYLVEASVGHVRDLPKRTLGVDEAHDFAPEYEVMADKKDVVKKLRHAAEGASTVFLAPDPDREGEAIAWHVAQLLKGQASAIKRIEFNEITARAVKDALQHPRALNENLFDAQQARRILDRLVGYKISPLLWKTVKRGISAGRVQSVTLRLIVDREHEREVFVPEEYWLFKALLEGKNPPPFYVHLQKIDGKKAAIGSEEEAKALLARISGQPFVVFSLETKERMRTPPPPFITSSLQQAANQRFGYSTKRTMHIAQKLYEGVEVADRGLTALITYMRTDSTRIADEAQKAALSYIATTYGEKMLPSKPRIFKVKGGAQDAHEAIRPVDVTLTPEMVRSSLSAEQYNIYTLIWNRFVASQMAQARIEDTIVLCACAGTLWRAHGERVLFQGYLSLMPQSKQEDVEDLPKVTQGETLNCKEIPCEQKFTQPPPRYSEASIVKEMEENGIGRPSTYAATISTLLERSYIEVKERHLIPTDLGRVVTSQLVENFPQLMDVHFTAQMEEDLDKVAAGGENWVSLMHSFSDTFTPALEAAAKNMRSVKKGLECALQCPTCGKPLLIKFGKTGSFLGCSDYPNCNFTSNFERDDTGAVHIVAREKADLEVVDTCPKCGRDMVVKKAHTGSRFIACTGYPDCDCCKPFSIGVVCPQCQKGELVERSSRRGKIFYSCSTYPACDFALWNKPVAQACPKCGSPYLLEKRSRAGVQLVCPDKNCDYVHEENEEADS